VVAVATAVLQKSQPERERDVVTELGSSTTETVATLWRRTSCRHWKSETLFKESCDVRVKVKGKGRTLDIAPQVAHCHRRGAQVHGVHQAASHIPIPSRP